MKQKKNVELINSTKKLIENILLNDRIDQVNIISFNKENSKLNNIVNLLKENDYFKKELRNKGIKLSLMEVDNKLINDSLFKSFFRANKRVFNVVLTDGYITANKYKNKYLSELKEVIDANKILSKLDNNFGSFNNVSVITTPYTKVDNKILSLIKSKMLKTIKIIDIEEKEIHLLIEMISELVFNNYTNSILKEYKDMKKKQSFSFNKKLEMETA